MGRSSEFSYEKLTTSIAIISCKNPLNVVTSFNITKTNYLGQNWPKHLTFGKLVQLKVKSSRNQKRDNPGSLMASLVISAAVSCQVRR